MDQEESDDLLPHSFIWVIFPVIQTCLLGNWYLQEVGPTRPSLLMLCALAGVIITNGILWLECLQEIDLHSVTLLLQWRTWASLESVGGSHFS